MLRLTEEGRRTVETATVRRRAEIATIVQRLRPAQRPALIEALDAFNEAGGEPPASTGGGDLHPLGWTPDLPAQRDA